MCLLAQINPLKHPHHDDDETRTIQLHHAHQVCGIVANTKDQGVSSVAIRSLAVAGGVLTDTRQQEEVLAILDRIYRSTGWNLKKVVGELRKAWGWDQPGAPTGGIAGLGAGSSLPAPAPAPILQPIVPAAAQGGPLVGSVATAAAVMNQQFVPRDPTMQQTQDARHPSQSQSQPQLHPPTPLPLLLAHVSSSSSPFSSAIDRHRQHSQPNNPGATPTLTTTTITTANTTATNTDTNTNLTTTTTPQHPGFGGPMAVAVTVPGVHRHNSIAGASTGSNQASPVGTAVHTPGSVSSTVANAATPPSRPMVNPLLAQADFNQPNHPYREWYKPPEKGGHGWFGSSGGGLWPY